MSIFHNEMMDSEAEAQKFQSAYNMLSEAIHACLRMLVCIYKEIEKQAYNTKEDHHLTPQALIIAFAETIDGISILVKAGSAKNCPTLLRTALELRLGLAYVLETDQDYKLRSLAYEFFHLKDELRWAEKCEPTNPIGKQLRAEIKGHLLADTFDVKGVDVLKQIADYEKKLNSDRYKDIQSEITRLKSLKQKPDNWFSLFGGPGNVRDLAYRLMEGPIYEALYRHWSSVSHGADGLKRYTFKKVGPSFVRPLRSPEELPSLAKHACNLCNSVSFSLVDKLVPGLREDTRSHFLNQVQPKLANIDRITIHK